MGSYSHFLIFLWSIADISLVDGMYRGDLSSSIANDLLIASISKLDNVYRSSIFCIDGYNKAETLRMGEMSCTQSILLVLNGSSTSKNFRFKLSVSMGFLLFF